MKYINVIILLTIFTAFGFQTNSITKPINVEQSTMISDQKIKNIPPFLEPIDKSKYKGQIQINPAPFPFNLTHPYVVWVDGEKVNLNMKEVKTLAKTLNLSLERPKDTTEIHSGDGWLHPLDID